MQDRGAVPEAHRKLWFDASNTDKDKLLTKEEVLAHE
jgi:hypothetical protein